jgi:mono/diheme cytochrome c family protein
MKTRQILLIVAVSSVFAVSSCMNGHQQSAKENVKASLTPEELISRGKYLVTVMGCHDCHSPKKMGPNGPEIIPELLLSGYPASRPVVQFDSKMIKEGFAMFYPDLTAAAGPWGVSFAGNLTPDQTGIGNWTEEQFKKALTQGKYKGLDGTRALLPPMPWFNMTVLTDEDIKAVFNYLKSIPPVSNVVPQPLTPDQLP